MLSVLAEPCCYAFASNAASDPTDFDKFWNSFLALKNLLVLNEGVLVTSEEIVDSLARTFPYSLLADRTAKTGEDCSICVGLIVRFLARYSTKVRYENREAESNCEEVIQRNGALYADADIWLAWIDLICQNIDAQRKQKLDTSELVLGHPNFSCLLNREQPVVIQLDSEAHKFNPVDLESGSIPNGLLDPRIWEKLESRLINDGDPAVVWEDSGHQPPVRIKRVVHRTAKACAAFVLRANSSYYNPAATSPCKLSIAAGQNQIAFLVCDGECVVKGYFTTIAADEAEQSLLKTLLDRSFLDQCRREDFHLA